ncbi:MAG: DUF4427 domain-containing protein [Phycisphaerales bacterium]|nr:DUF4427 domain-containing protein [Phycisphaerales bacterium]
MFNNRRFDLSSRVVHFFREVDLSGDSSVDFPEHWGFGNIAEDTTFSPLFLLRCAIRHGRLFATWARRKNQRTIYGPYPAVCFTDMPTAAFIEAAASRSKRGEKMSTYALTFQKTDAFARGARPVIYGLSGAARMEADTGPARILKPTVLPYREQYRYVTYRPTKNRWNVDWTHEREWRWRMSDDMAVARFEREIELDGIVSEVADIPSLRIYSEGFKEIGVIVKTAAESLCVIHDILMLYDRRRIAKDTFKYVLVSERIPSVKAIRDPNDEAKAIANAAIELEPLLAIRDESLVLKIKEICQRVTRKHEGEPLNGDPGTCWVWIRNPIHRAARALMNDGHIQVTKGGKYLLAVPEIPAGLALERKQAIIVEISKEIADAVGVDCGYYSVMGQNPDSVPFYCDIMNAVDNRLLFNHATGGVAPTTESSSPVPPTGGQE